MSITINSRGTSVPFFKIGKAGTTFYQGTADPAETYSPVTGDYWFNKTSNSINTRVGGAWVAPKLAQLSFPAGTGIAGQVLTTDGIGNLSFTTLSGTGSVTSVSVVTANGISGSVATATSTPAITLTLGAITPTSVAATSTVTGSNLSGTNTGDQTITLTGDVTGTGPGSFAATLATVNAAPQTDTFRKITVNSKGLVTATSAVLPADITDALGYVPAPTTGGSLTVDQLTIGTTMNIDDASITTSSTTPDQVVAIVSASIYRSVKYLVQAVSGTDYQMSELNIIHNGTTAYVTEYGTVLTGARVATFDADLSGASLRLLVTPVNSDTTIKMIRSAITL